MDNNLYNQFLSEIQQKFDKQQRKEKELLELAEGIIAAVNSELSFAVVGTIDAAGIFRQGGLEVENGKLPFAVSVKFKDRGGEELFVALVSFVAKKEGLDFCVQAVETSRSVTVLSQDRSNVEALKKVVDLLGDPVRTQVNEFVKKELS
jgi:hypothetical protein